MAAFVDTLKARGHLDQIHLRICNVGSRKINPRDDYDNQGWDVFAPNLTIYGFDADADACEAANADLEARHVNWQEYHLPYALSRTSGVQTLYVTKHPMCSSLYPPNEPLNARFEVLPEAASLDFTVELETITLDELYASEAMEGVDFLQVDVQGAELDVFKGAQQTLATQVLCIETEVEFAPLYLGQPLFADVDAYLRPLQFSLFDVSANYLLRRGTPLQQRPGQILWGNAVYMRDLAAIADTSPLATPSNLLKLACMADVMGFVDYALEILTVLTIRYGRDEQYNLADGIVDALAQVPALAEQGLEKLVVLQNLRDYIQSPQHPLKF